MICASWASAAPATFWRMTIIAMLFDHAARRRKLFFSVGSLDEGLALAAALFAEGSRNAAFDLLEQLLLEGFTPGADILVLAHDLYARLPERSRYALYQSRRYDFPIRPGDKVLDMGSGHIPFPLATHLADISLSDHGLGRAGEPFQFIDGKPCFECGVEKTPFADKEFDFVYCSHVLEHATDPEAACAELARIGRRGFIETPAPGKDLFLNAAGVSGHRWAVENAGGVLVFTEYSPRRAKCLGHGILQDMHNAPRTDRERVFSALVHLMAENLNTMLMWEDGIDVEVRSLRPRSGRGPASKAPVIVRVGEAPVAQAPPERLSLVQGHLFYGPYLDGFYARNPGLEQSSFRTQMDELVGDAFSGIHIMPPYLDPLGYDARLLVPNCRPAQEQWARERGLPFPEGDWVRETTLLQLEEISPDAVYFGDPAWFDSAFARRMKKRPRLLAGWRAANLPHDADWTEYDLILSSLSGVRRAALERGARAAEHFTPGFPAWYLDQIEEARLECDVVFSGQCAPTQHVRRNHLLTVIAGAAEKHGFSFRAHTSPSDPKLQKALGPHLRPPVFGLEMLRALRSGAISFDARGSIELKNYAEGSGRDIAGAESANMRIFESTGAGTFLLTEHYDNVAAMFEPGREIETFRDEKELVDKILYYLGNPSEREDIARRGRTRCFKDHEMNVKARLFDSYVRKHIDAAAEKRSKEETKVRRMGS